MNKFSVFLFTIGITINSVPVRANGIVESRKSKEERSFPSYFFGLTTPRQLITITGTITDNSGKLPGVSVSVKGKQTVVISDNAGKYSIEAEAADVLVFSYVGYKTVEISVDGVSTIDVQLQEDATTLQEVSVNAGYYNVKEKERTGSISKITSKDIEKQPVTNVLAAMQGRMAGVNITQNSGVPGSGFEIQIRGQNSVRPGGNNALFIIDGVPYAADAIGSGQNSAVLPGNPSPLNSINPDQIESIEVLKDADATAIYGSRGANGVVLITTKKGKAGQTKFTAKAWRGAGTVTRFADLLNTEQYLAMRNEALANDGFTTPPGTAYDVNGTWDINRYTDWQKTLIGGTSDITDVQASVTGGSERTHFLLSGAFNKQTTVFPGDFNYKKANVHLNVNHTSEDRKFQSNFSVGYTVQDNVQPRMDLMSQALKLPPNAPALYDEEGNLNWEGSTWTNPLGFLVGEYTAKTNDLIANGLLSYQLTNSLQVRSSLGYTTVHNDEVTAAPSTQYDPAYGVGAEFSSLIVGATSRKSWIVEPQLNWKKTFGSAKVDVLVGSTFQSQTGNQMVQFASGFSSNSLIYNLASASDISIFIDEESEYKYQAYFGRVNLNWKDKYILNLTGRRDGSSRFGPGKQYASFGAVGGAWVFSQERLLKDNRVLSFGKLRASYGVTGSDQIGNYQYLDTYGSTGVNYGGVIGLQPTRLYNPEFGWETNKKFEVAAEVGFLEDRIFLTAGWYSNRSSNQLAAMPLPGTTGFASLQTNLAATVENKGTELTLRTVNVQRKDFGWTTSLNLTFSRNKLLEFPDLASSTYRNTYVIGEPLNIRKVYHFTGVDPDTGIYTFEDKNGDGVLTTADDRTTVKDLNPDYYGGFQNSLRYKRFQLDFLFQFAKQQNFNSYASHGPAGNMSNQPTSVMNHWQQPGDVAPHQIFTNGTNSGAVGAYDYYAQSDALISDASYVRLKNISISYDVPERLLKNVHCRLFAEAQNLLTFTKFEGADPEFKTSGFLPPLRIISAGLQLTF